MKQMQFKKVELSLLLLMKIADIISNPVSVKQIHSLVITLSQLTEYPKARDIYQKLSIYGLNDVDEFNKHTLHYFRFPINCNVYSVSVNIEELIRYLDRPNFFVHKEVNLGTLLKAYCTTFSSKSNFDQIQLEIMTKQIIDVFEEVKNKLEICSEIGDPSLIKDLMGLVVSILKSFSGSH